MARHISPYWDRRGRLGPSPQTASGEIEMPIYARFTKDKLDYAQGDSTEPGHLKWVEVLSLQPLRLKAPDPNPDQPAPPGDNNPGDITITKAGDSASQKLAMAWHAGTSMDVTLDFIKTSATTGPSYLRITATGAIISGIMYSSDGNGRSVEAITFNFLKLTYDEGGLGDDVSGQLPASFYANPGTH
jgi:type VI protein secretion system component Hcp